MRISRLDPELQGIFRFVPPLPVTTRLGRAVVDRLLRLRAASAHPDGIDVSVVTLPNGQSARVFTPAGGGNGGALLNIHGGGLITGTAGQDDAHMAEVVRNLGIVVVSAEYRLAPKDPFHAGLDDCHAAWTWMVSRAEDLGVDPARIAIGGQSAGGGLAATLVQRLHDQGGVQPAAQWLFCPMLDDRTATRRDQDAVKHRVWNNKTNRFAWRAYLGQEPGSADVPAYAVASRRDDLAGLPPAWIGVGDLDLFFDEGRAYAVALRDAWVETTLDVVSGAPHGFETVASGTDLATRYRKRAQAWLGNKLLT